MKNLFLALSVTFALALGAVSGRAQTYGGSYPLLGQTNILVYSGSTYITNYVGISLPAKVVTLSGIVTTNQTFGYTYLLSLPGYTNGPWTNLYPLGGFTNNFLTGTNSGSWATNYPGGYTNLVFPLILNLNTGTNSVNVYIP